MVNLLDYDRKALQLWLQEQGEQPYRATQLIKWIHQFGVTDFQKMTNLSMNLRNMLADKANCAVPKIRLEQKSTDGTIKWLLELCCGNCVETVFIPEEGRGTLCISSQVGCALNCSFCSTARQGFNRNLTAGEIIGQVWLAVRQLSTAEGRHDRKITNVVLMGMGEPLLNLDNVLKALNLMMDDDSYGLSKRRVTVSTSGLVPAMKKLGESSQVALAVSLHAANDKLRDELVPINKKYPLAQLMTVCKDYFKDEPRRKVVFEYVMLAGVNDSIADAKQLVALLANVPAKVNLIPFNAFPGAPYQCSTKQQIDKFRNILMAADINTITRKTRGDDIDAACGQLVGKVDDKTKRRQQYAKENN